MVVFWALQFVLFGQAETQSLFWGLCKGSCKGEGKHRSTSLMAAPVDELEDPFTLVHTGVQDPWAQVLVTWDQNQLLPLPVPQFPELKNQEARLRQCWASCSQFWGSCSPFWGCPRALPRDATAPETLLLLVSLCPHPAGPSCRLGCLLVPPGWSWPCVAVRMLPLTASVPAQTDLYSGALFVHVCLGWNLYLCTVLMLLVTGLYTIAGRLLGLCCPHSIIFGFIFSIVLWDLYSFRLRPRGSHPQSSPAGVCASLLSISAGSDSRRELSFVITAFLLQ